jgi:hypothetical protein
VIAFNRGIDANETLLEASLACGLVQARVSSGARAPCVACACGGAAVAGTSRQAGR